MNRPWHCPLAVIGHRERRRRPGGCFFGLEAAGFLGVGGLGVDDLEQPTAQDPQRAGVVVGGLTKQERLGLLPHRCVDLVRAGRRPRRRSRSACSTLIAAVGQRLIHRRMGRVESGRQPCRTMGGRSGGPRLVGQPVRRRRRPHRRADVDPLGVDEQPQLQLGDLRFQSRDIDQRGLGLGGGHRPHRRPNDRRHALTHRRHGGRHRVGRVEEVCRHGQIQAPATDTFPTPVDDRQRTLSVGERWLTGRAPQWSPGVRGSAWTASHLNRSAPSPSPRPCVAWAGGLGGSAVGGLHLNAPVCCPGPLRVGLRRTLRRNLAHCAIRSACPTGADRARYPFPR